MSVRLSREPLDVASLLAAVQAPERGGTCVFVGTVRPDQDAIAIDYSAHDAMAEAELERIVAEARRRWPDAETAVEHRLGRVPVGEASVAVAAAAPHRREAFEACRFVIEAIKVSLPVWKREERADGTADWVDNEGRRISSAGEPPAEADGARH